LLSSSLPKDLESSELFHTALTYDRGWDAFAADECALEEEQTSDNDRGPLVAGLDRGGLLLPGGIHCDTPVLLLLPLLLVADCAQLFLRGFRLSPRVLRAVADARDEGECQRFCVDEDRFECRGFAFRGASRLGAIDLGAPDANVKNCELTDVRANDLDPRRRDLDPAKVKQT